MALVFIIFPGYYAAHNNSYEEECVKGSLVLKNVYLLYLINLKIHIFYCQDTEIRLQQKDLTTMILTL